MTQALPIQGQQQMQCVVLSVQNDQATVRDQFGRVLNLRRDVMRAKGRPPEVGETWIIDRFYGNTWAFACVVGADLDPLAFPSIPVVDTMDDLLVLPQQIGLVAYVTSAQMLCTYRQGGWWGSVAVGGSTSATRHEARYYQNSAQSGLVDGNIYGITYETFQNESADFVPNPAHNQWTVTRGGWVDVHAGYRITTGAVTGTAELIVSIGPLANDNTIRYAAKNERVALTGTALTMFGTIQTKRLFTPNDTISVNVRLVGGGSWATVLQTETAFLALTWERPAVA